MKSKRDPRHLARIKLIQDLFAASFQTNKNYHLSNSTNRVLSKKKELDSLIEKYASAWPIEQVAPIDLAILRSAIWELLYFKKTPVKVVIDEAIEIAKSYGSETSGSFVNGVLGSIVDHQLSSSKKVK